MAPRKGGVELAGNEVRSASTENAPALSPNLGYVNNLMVGGRLSCTYDSDLVR